MPMFSQDKVLYFIFYFAGYALGLQKSYVHFTYHEMSHAIRHYLKKEIRATYGLRIEMERLEHPSRRMESCLGKATRTSEVDQIQSQRTSNQERGVVFIENCLMVHPSLSGHRPDHHPRLLIGPG
jgi:hypothetical protein